MASNLAGSLTGGLFGSTPDYAALAKKSEAKRKALIDLGMNQINAVFEGGTAPFYSLANAGGAKFQKKGTTYYSFGKKGFVPYWGPKINKPNEKYSKTALGAALESGGGDLINAVGFQATGLGNLFSKHESPAQIAAKKFRRGLLFNAPEMKTFEGYTPSFYSDRAKAYTDYALPEVADQYLNARDAQTFGLANRGLLSSSIARQARSELERQIGQARINVADTAENEANNLRKQVEGSRQQAIDQLYQTADPARAFSSAINSASQLEHPAPFAPIVNTFDKLASQYYLNQVLNNYKAGGSNFSDDDFNYSSALAKV